MRMLTLLFAAKSDGLVKLSHKGFPKSDAEADVIRKVANERLLALCKRTGTQVSDYELHEFDEPLEDGSDDEVEDSVHNFVEGVRTLRRLGEAFDDAASAGCGVTELGEGERERLERERVCGPESSPERDFTRIRDSDLEWVKANPFHVGVERKNGVAEGVCVVLLENAGDELPMAYWHAGGDWMEFDAPHLVDPKIFKSWTAAVRRRDKTNADPIRYVAEIRWYQLSSVVDPIDEVRRLATAKQFPGCPRH